MKQWMTVHGKRKYVKASVYKDNLTAWIQEELNLSMSLFSLMKAAVYS